MKKLASSICILGVVMSCAGCATMFTDKTQNISFKTKPSGAEVAVGTQTCTTPCTMTIDKGKWNVQAIVSKDGYNSQSIIMVPKVEPWTFANIANMGFGLVVDMVTGTYIKYENEYYAPLSKN